MTTLVMLSLFVFGLLAYLLLPVSNLPNVDLPTIEVTVSYPGTNPETMATTVAIPLEKEFMTIDGIETIFSSSGSGSTDILLSFALNRNMDSASTDVQAAISRAQPYLPPNLPNQPVYRKVNPATTPILYFVISSPNMTLGTLYDYGNTFLGQRIAMVEGVAQVNTYGSPYAVRIQVDPERLAAKEIGMDDVVNAVATSNVSLPVGVLYGEKEDFTLRVQGQLLTASPYEEIIIKNQNGELVKLKDIGQALDSVQRDKTFRNYVTKKGDVPCIILAIRNLPGANTVKTTEKIHALIEELQPQLPETLHIETIYEKSESILESVEEVKLTLLIAFLLVVAIIFLMLGKGLNTIIPSLALPLVILSTFTIMYVLDFSLDILSLLAITLSIGFLVDDAIVVLENNVRHVEMGASPFEAAILSAKEIGVTVLSMTCCLIAAFIPNALSPSSSPSLFQASFPSP